MCGIAGILCDDPTRLADIETCTRMTRALAHRGPDDEGAWNEGPAALVHRRLSILDTSPAGRQPMHSACGRFVVTYNGEIYNFREVRTELVRLGYAFHTECDTEVLLAAHAAWGDDAVQRFVGMFAYALYDRAQRRMVLVRDRLGVKPLFYTQRNGVLAFASELNALRAGGFASGAIRPECVDAYFTYLYIPAPDTIYDGVYKLRPGEMLSIADGRMKTRRYWKPEWRIDESWTFDAAAERYHELLDESVRLRLISDVPLGAFLSGGLDSSTVVAAMARQCAQPVKTFSIGFDDAHYNELRYARIAARHAGTDHTEEILRPDLVSLLPSLVSHFGEPFADSSALPMWLVSQIARRAVTVALSGDGGDELFAGYTWTGVNHHVARYRRVPAALRSAIGLTLACSPRSPLVDRLRRFHDDAALAPSESFRRRLTCLGPAARASLYQPEFTVRVAQHAVDRFREHWDADASLSDDDRMLQTDTAMYLPDDILTKVDRMSMAHGLEARVPLLDHRIVEFAATLPFHLKLKARVSKRVAKHAARDLLPPELLAQRKHGFAIPIHRWFREALAPHFAETVLAGDARCRQYVRPEAARALFEDHRAHRAENGHALWALLIFEYWLRG